MNEICKTPETASEVETTSIALNGPSKVNRIASSPIKNEFEFDPLELLDDVFSDLIDVCN